MKLLLDELKYPFIKIVISYLNCFGGDQISINRNIFRLKMILL